MIIFNPTFIIQIKVKAQIVCSHSTPQQSSDIAKAAMGNLYTKIHPFIASSNFLKAPSFGFSSIVIKENC